MESEKNGFRHLMLTRQGGQSLPWSSILDAVGVGASTIPLLIAVILFHRRVCQLIASLFQTGRPAVGYGFESNLAWNQSNSAIRSAKPQTNKPTPAARETMRPEGTIFSNSTKIVRPAIQIIFITPPTKSNAINAQQQPTQ